MPPTLLADLAFMMASSAEDVATRALELVLLRPAAQAATSRLLNSWRRSPGPEVVHWSSQVSGADEARTDLQGVSETEDVIAIFENKFWAGLTDNQPTTYLARLSELDGVLAFLVPASRIPLIRHELDLRLREVEGGPVIFDRRSEADVAQLSSGRTLVVTSWLVVLTCIRSELEAAQDLDGLADVRQLEGLVSRAEHQGFRPLTCGDVTGETPRLIVQLSELVDDVVKEFQTRDYVDRKGLQAGVGKGYYGPYFRIHGHVCHLMVNASWWAERGISPVWLRVSAADHRLQEELRLPMRAAIDDGGQLFVKAKGSFAGLWTPIRLVEGRDKQAVVRDALRQLEKIAGALESHVVRSSGAHAALPSSPAFAADSPTSVRA